MASEIIVSAYHSILDELKTDSEDRLKSEISILINYYNSLFIEKDFFAYARLCNRCYEQIRYDSIKNLKGLIKKLVPRNNDSVNAKKTIKKSYSQEEYITRGLFIYSENYKHLSPHKKNKRDREALRFIKKFYHSSNRSILLKYYRMYDNMKSSGNIEIFDPLELY